MKQILLMIAVVASAGCGKKPVAASVLEQAWREAKDVGPFYFMAVMMCFRSLTP